MITRLVLLMLVGEYVYCPVYIPSAFEQLIVQVKAVRIALRSYISRCSKSRRCSGERRELTSEFLRAFRIFTEISMLATDLSRSCFCRRVIEF